MKSGAVGKTFNVVVWLNVFWVLFHTGVISPLVDSTAVLATLLVVPSLLMLIGYQIYLGRRITEITQRDVDSVYYVGFLITLMVLAASAFQVSTAKPDSFDAIVSGVGAKFALGLLVTGYGLFARINLLGRLRTAENTATLLDDYALKIGLINDRIDESARTIDEFTRRLFDLVRENVRASGSETLKTISEDLRPAVSDLKSVITDVNRALGRFRDGKFSDLAAVAESLSLGLSKVVDVTPAMCSSIDQIGACVRELAAAQDGFVVATKQAESGLRGIDSAVVALGHSVQPTSAHLSALGVAAGRSMESVTRLPAAMDAASAGFEATGAGAKSLSVTLEASRAAALKYSAALDASALERFRDALTGAAVGAVSAAEHLRLLAVNVEAAAGGAATQIGGSVTVLTSTTAELADASAALGSAMVRLAQAIRSAADDAQR
jgi:hypothetical protein